MAGAEEVVLFEKRGHVAIFTLNRPKARNAISLEVATRLEALLEQFEADDDLWVGIVASSSAGVFCAGADLKSINKGKPVSTRKGGFAGFVHFPSTKPLIAAVAGAALAGGLEIVLACDLVVASEHASFGLPEVARSLTPAAGGLFRLPRKVPHAIALEIMFTAQRKSAQDMARFGLVNVLVDGPAEGANERVLDAALRLANQIAENAPLAVREVKRVVGETWVSADDKTGFQKSNESMARLMRSEDFFEGPRAFIEKRKPRWTGKLRSKL